MLNHITIMGRLTADPELRRADSGIPVASFALAVERDFANKETGQREVDFIPVIAWRGSAEFVTKYFSKGRVACVSGRLQIRNYTDKEGNKRKAAEVVADSIYFGDTKPKAEEGAPANSSYQSGEFHPIDVEADDGLPFIT